MVMVRMWRSDRGRLKDFIAALAPAQQEYIYLKKIRNLSTTEIVFTKTFQLLESLI